jgi:hypothetical protein
VLLATLARSVSLRVRIKNPREVLQTLRPEEWERHQGQNPGVHSICKKRDGFSPRAEPPTDLRRPHVFGMANLRRLASLTLRRPNHIRCCGL